MCFWCYLEVFLWEAVELLPNQGTLSLVMCVWRFLPCSSSPSQTSTAIELGLRGTWELHITVYITNSHTARGITLTRFLVFLGDCTAVPQTLNKAQNRFIFLGVFYCQFSLLSSPPSHLVTLLSIVSFHPPHLSQVLREE